MTSPGSLAGLVRGRAARELDEAATRNALAAAGFDQPQSSLASLDLLIRASGDLDACAGWLAGCADAADPGRALHNLSRLAESSEGDLAALGALDGAGLARFLGASQQLADLLVARPGLVRQLGKPFDADGAELRYDDAAREAERESVLRRTQQSDLLSIAWSDLVDGIDVELITAHLSRLADASVAGAARGIGADRHFAIIALGKLGGSELNYSSDIDLLFVRPDDHADQVSADRAARQLVNLVGRQTADGHLYRVDMRLRPEGQTGVLTRTVASCLDYYERYGRPWERQMLIKARVLHESGGAGAAFLEGTRRWIVRCGLDAGAILQFKRLKSLAERHHAPAAGRSDVKHQAGGIRDIETVVQFLALLQARFDDGALTPSTLHGLERLRVAGAINSLDASRLRSAYRFHRRVENLLQVMHRVQTHLLPDDCTPLARLTGRRDAESFLAEFEEHRRRVREIFERHVSLAFEHGGGPAEALTELLLAPELDTEETQRVLVATGYGDDARNVEVLSRASGPASRFLIASPRLRGTFASLAPRLLERLALAPDPDAALDRFERMTRGVGAREVLYAHMQEEPRLADVLCDLAAGSPYLCELLLQDAPIVDALMDAVLTGLRGRTRRRERLEHLAHRGGGDPWLVLSDHRTVELLRIGIQDLQERVPIRTTLAELSHLCIDVLRHAFALVHAELEREHGTPRVLHGMGMKVPAEMVVVALGKLGGLEANYASDADLLFVSSGEGQTDDGLANSVFFSRLAETFIARVGGAKGSPRLYKIDTRLRPEGAKGPLVTTLRQLQRYYGSGRAALFERQALLKARVVAGDAALGQDVLSLLRKVVRSTEVPDDFADKMRAMRAKIEASAHGHDLKRGTGGMIDVEFLVQALQLAHGRRHPSILVPETVAALEACADAGLVAAQRARRLVNTYLFFRRVETRLQLTLGFDTKQVPDAPDAVRQLALRLGYADTAEGDAGHLLLVDLEDRQDETRRDFDDMLP